MSQAQRPRNPNRGYLAPNEKGKPSHPDWRGKLHVDGKDYLVSGWFKDVTNNNGQTAQIISFELTAPASLPQRPPAQGQAAPAAPSQAQSSPQQAPASSGKGGAAFDDIFEGSGSF